MCQETIKKFLYEKSQDLESWFTGINALYDKTNSENLERTILSDVTLQWIRKQSKSLASELDIMNETDRQETQLELNALNKIKYSYNLFSFFGKRNLVKWRALVKGIKESNEDYIDNIKQLQLDYLVISEAPMLNFESGKFSCNYVFGENPKVGSYRKVPYKAFGGTDESLSISSCDLIKIFKNKKVGFFDLIPIPLPKIDTELRRLWSQDIDYYIDDLPRTIYFLKLAFENFINNSECTMSEKTKVILMMPPNTAMGIISFYLGKKVTKITDLDNLSKMFIRENNNCNVVRNVDLNGIPVRLHRQIVMNGSGGPDLKLFQHAL
jgi:hypothetical protein